MPFRKPRGLLCARTYTACMQLCLALAEAETTEEEELGEALTELARLILEHLEELGIGLGDAGDVDDTLVDAVDQRVVYAVGRDAVLAPRLLRRAHGAHHVSGQRALEVVGSRGDERVSLFVADEFVKRHDPRASS